MSTTVNVHVEDGQRARFVEGSSVRWIDVSDDVALFVPRDRTEAYEYLGSLIDAANKMSAVIMQEAVKR